METDSGNPHPQRIFVAGHTGMVGSAVCRVLQTVSHVTLLVRTRAELNLTRQDEVDSFFDQNQPDAVIFAAGRVGGIEANRKAPAAFLSENLAMISNTMEAARRTHVRRFVFLGSTCIYPAAAPQPLRECDLLSSSLDPGNEAYALAKIAGIRFCEYVRRETGLLWHSVMPTNLYGPGDNFHPTHSHVVPGLIRRFHDAIQSRAATMNVWGDGSALRELLHVDDLARAILLVASHPDPPDLINVGSGEEVSVLQLAQRIACLMGYQGRIVTDPSMPQGLQRKLCDSSRIRTLGWAPQVTLESGLRSTIDSFLQSLKNGTLRER